ncbi:phospholipase [Marilutibacter chinensis]|uniref:Phospholipase n=1 Tax=Marilutibacter chinensis TaxID=2912247 RepID=A0ABS9HVI2_9GAMM|nr:phospholipase [Lysobacter chinensis]MCF7222170.1 phospholipase [Lysobacter chinensis]
MSTPANHQERRAFLEQLQAQADPESLRQADALRRLYHDREMAGLADDVYDAAMRQGEPPPGWKRASEHLDELRVLRPELAQYSRDQLQELLQPVDSRFRAEIYLPDESVLGPGYQPTAVFKGSRGEVMTADGLVDSTAEDFIANNFPQSVGLKTDYYDRAMELGTRLKRAGLEFETAGHSLGGGMSSAMSAVTGAPSTTFNAAGLHPETAARYARTHPNVQLHDTDRTVRAYQVEGEILTDGVQENLTSLGAVQNAQLAGVIRETAELTRDLPQGRALLQQFMSNQISPSSHPVVEAFLARISERDTPQLLRELPLAAGQEQPRLAAMTNGDDGPVARDDIPSLRELVPDAAPLLTSLHATAYGARAGQRFGEGIEWTFCSTGRSMDGVGDLYRSYHMTLGATADGSARIVGEATGTAVRWGGEVVAQTHEARAGFSATIELAEGYLEKGHADLKAGVLRGIGDWLPDSLGERFHARAERIEQAGEQARRRSIDEAATELGDGRDAAESARAGSRELGERITDLGRDAGTRIRDGYADHGRQVDQALDRGGDALCQTGRQAPAYGAAVGGATTGLLTAGVVHNPTTLHGVANLERTGRFVSQIGPAASEATARHLMSDTVLPSLDHRIREVEQAARERLQGRQAPVAGEQTRADAVDAAPGYPSPAIANAHERLERLLAGGIDPASRAEWDREVAMHRERMEPAREERELTQIQQQVAQPVEMAR